VMVEAPTAQVAADAAGRLSRAVEQLLGER